MKYYLVHCFLLCSLLLSAATDDENMVMNDSFWETKLVGEQTTRTTNEGGFAFDFAHYFKTDNPANIIGAASYGITDRLDVNAMYQRYDKALELGVKYRIFEQTIDNTVPLTVAWYSSMSCSFNDKEDYSYDYVLTDRFFYHHQLLAAKQINYKYKVQAAVGFVHFNKVDASQSNDMLDFDVALGYKLSKASSLFVNYTHPVSLYTNAEEGDHPAQVQPSLTVGWEKSTYKHHFQLFVSNSPNYSAGLNTQNISSVSFDNLCYGFNVKMKLNDLFSKRK